MYFKDGCGVLNVVGPKLKSLRNDKNISQTEFSKLCKEKGVKRSVATISKIENQIDELYSLEPIVIEEDVQDAC